MAHDSDGDWQFLDDDYDDDQPGSEDDIALVHLAHIVERFPEVVLLADLPVGWTAQRDTADEPWTREREPSD